MKHFAFALFVLTASPAAAEDDFVIAVQSLTNNLALPALQALSENADNTRTTVEEFCAGNRKPDQIHAAFHYHMDAWQRVRVLNFGPLTKGDGVAAFQFWPDKRGTGSRQLNKYLTSLDKDAPLHDLTTASVALGDLQALELLLFGDPGLLPKTPSCALASSIAERQLTLANKLLADWQNEFASALLTSANGNDLYYDASEALGEFVSAITSNLDHTIANRLDRPMGSSFEKNRPKRGENWRSQRAVANILAGLEMSYDLFRTEGSIKDLLTERGSGPMADGVARLFEKNLESLRNLPLPLSQAVQDREFRASLEEILNDLKTLRTVVGGPVAGDLGLAIGFNATDGD